MYDGRPENLTEKNKTRNVKLDKNVSWNLAFYRLFLLAPLNVSFLAGGC